MPLKNVLFGKRTCNPTTPKNNQIFGWICVSNSLALRRFFNHLPCYGYPRLLTPWIGVSLDESNWLLLWIYISWRINSLFSQRINSSIYPEQNWNLGLWVTIYLNSILHSKPLGHQFRFLMTLLDKPLTVMLKPLLWVYQRGYHCHNIGQC